MKTQTVDDASVKRFLPIYPLKVAASNMRQALLNSPIKRTIVFIKQIRRLFSHTSQGKTIDNTGRNTVAEIQVRNNQMLTTEPSSA
jgi:hypothetical protein